MHGSPFEIGRLAVMAFINEIDRARMVVSLSKAIGNEEANVLASALNLDGQLASRDELRVMEMAIRNDIADLRIGFRAELGSVVQGQTRALFFGILGGIAAITGIVIGTLQAAGMLLLGENTRFDHSAVWTGRTPLFLGTALH